MMTMVMIDHQHRGGCWLWAESMSLLLFVSSSGGGGLI
jgi:hypothetical protein